MWIKKMKNEFCCEDCNSTGRAMVPRTAKSGIKFTDPSVTVTWSGLYRSFSSCLRIILEEAMDIPKNGESSTSPVHRSASPPRYQAGANGVTEPETADGGPHQHLVEKSRLILPAWDGE
jgi:hypothetical protein